MAARMVKTRHPGIYRRGSRYAVVYRAHGKQRWESTRTLDEALRLKRSREADRDRGEFQAESRIPFRQFAEEWVERYRGNGKRGFTENSREHYKRDLAKFAYPFFDERLGRTISAITPRDVDRWIAWLIEQPNGRGGTLSDATIRRALAPVRSCLATARREGLIRSNPADKAVLPRRDEQDVEDEEPKARALTRAQLGMFLRIVPSSWRLLFEFLAATGLRWSELVALRWCDVVLDGGQPHIRVRRAIVPALGRKDGEGPWRVKPPKSKHGKRDIPITLLLADKLRTRRVSGEWSEDDDLVFSATNGEPLRHGNVRRRVLEPAAEEADLSWVGFHTFRHTCASILFESGRNPKQISRWLGHHAASFTVDVYAHLLDDGVGEGLDLAAELESANKVQTSGASLDVPHGPSAPVEMAFQGGSRTLTDSNVPTE